MSRSTCWLSILLVLAVGVPAVAVPAQDDPYAEDLVAAARFFQRGELRKAESLWQELLDEWEETKGKPDETPAEVVFAARLGVLRVALRGGEYRAVKDGVAALPAAERARREYALLAIEAELETGGYEAAEQGLRALLAIRADDTQARVRLGELLLETGRRDDGLAALRAASEGRGGDAEALTWRARARMRLGGRQNVEEASGLLVEAVRAAPDEWLPRTLYGLLRFDVYGEWSGAASGERALLDVLERNGEIVEALVALHRIRSQNHLLDPQKTETFLDRALAANPRCVQALVARAVAWIDDRRFEDGVRGLDAALAVDPRNRRTLAQRAAVALVSGDTRGFEDFRARALELAADWGGVELALGDRLVALYRFADAVPHYRAALAIDKEDVDAMHGLAKALIYSARGEEAREILVAARELRRGFVHPWRNNMIAVQDLLTEEYETVDDGGFRFLLHRDDAQVLTRYLLPEARTAKQTLDAKYGLVPDGPVRLEAFHTWADFSVRTVGFRGFTALGACFGPLITFVSPVDRDLRQNDFMWTATLWHEYTHVLTLALSRHRVPRWLTEGFSVYEERQRDKSWERGMERELVDALANGEVAPIALFNRVFRGPRILFGYYKGGLLVEFLAKEYGFDKVVQLLRAYGEDLSAEAAFARSFGVDTRTIDRAFIAWLHETKTARLRIVPRYGDAAVDALRARVARDPADLDAHVALAWSALQRGVDVDASMNLREIFVREPDHPAGTLIHAEILRRRRLADEALAAWEKAFATGLDDFDSRLRCAETLEAKGDDDGAIRQYLAAKRCWPECTDQQTSPELRLARLHRAAGRTIEAMMELETFCRRTARAYAPRLELAGFAREAGDRRREIELLEQCVAIDPFDRAVHRALGAAYVEVGSDVLAVREYEALLAIPAALDRGPAPGAAAEPPDPAAFATQQAEACVALGRTLQRLERGDAARAAFERAIREAPESEAADTARELLGKR
ncbi:MAG: tetratricopeptide repeat protein [Planctomycetes bacterium]|nr:tetratricopeptide repeat protein [Planctomycetota bacterium]